MIQSPLIGLVEAAFVGKGEETHESVSWVNF